MTLKSPDSNKSRGIGNLRLKLLAYTVLPPRGNVNVILILETSGMLTGVSNAAGVAGGRHPDIAI